MVPQSRPRISDLVRIARQGAAEPQAEASAKELTAMTPVPGLDSNIPEEACTPATASVSTKAKKRRRESTCQTTPVAELQPTTPLSAGRRTSTLKKTQESKAGAADSSAKKKSYGKKKRIPHQVGTPIACAESEPDRLAFRDYYQATVQAAHFWLSTPPSGSHTKAASQGRRLGYDDAVPFSLKVQSSIPGSFLAAAKSPGASASKAPMSMAALDMLLCQPGGVVSSRVIQPSPRHRQPQLREVAQDAGWQQRSVASCTGLSSMEVDSPCHGNRAVLQCHMGEDKPSAMGHQREPSDNGMVLKCDAVTNAPFAEVPAAQQARLACAGASLVPQSQLQPTPQPFQNKSSVNAVNTVTGATSAGLPDIPAASGQVAALFASPAPAKPAGMHGSETKLRASLLSPAAVTDSDDERSLLSLLKKARPGRSAGQHIAAPPLAFSSAPSASGHWRARTTGASLGCAAATTHVKTSPPVRSGPEPTSIAVGNHQNSSAPSTSSGGKTAEMQTQQQQQHQDGEEARNELDNLVDMLTAGQGTGSPRGVQPVPCSPFMASLAAPGSTLKARQKQQKQQGHEMCTRHMGEPSGPSAQPPAAQARPAAAAAVKPARDASAATACQGLPSHDRHLFRERQATEWRPELSPPAPLHHDAQIQGSGSQPLEGSPVGTPLHPKQLIMPGPSPLGSTPTAGKVSRLGAMTSTWATIRAAPATASIGSDAEGLSPELLMPPPARTARGTPWPQQRRPATAWLAGPSRQCTFWPTQPSQQAQPPEADVAKRSKTEATDGPTAVTHADASTAASHADAIMARTAGEPRAAGLGKSSNTSAQAGDVAVGRRGSASLVPADVQMDEAEAATPTPNGADATAVMPDSTNKAAATLSPATTPAGVRTGVNAVLSKHKGLPASHGTHGTARATKSATEVATNASTIPAEHKNLPESQQANCADSTEAMHTTTGGMCEESRPPPRPDNPAGVLSPGFSKAALGVARPPAQRGLLAQQRPASEVPDSCHPPSPAAGSGLQPQQSPRPSLSAGAVGRSGIASLKSPPMGACPSSAMQHGSQDADSAHLFERRHKASTCGQGLASKVNLHGSSNSPHMAAGSGSHGPGRAGGAAPRTYGSPHMQGSGRLAWLKSPRLAGPSSTAGPGFAGRVSEPANVSGDPGPVSTLMQGLPGGLFSIQRALAPMPQRRSRQAHGYASPPLAPSMTVEQSLREAYIEAKIAHEWHVNGAAWARMDLHGVEIAREPLAEYERRLADMKHRFRSFRGMATLPSIIATLEQEWRQLQAFRTALHARAAHATGPIRPRSSCRDALLEEDSGEGDALCEIRLLPSRSMASALPDKALGCDAGSELVTCMVERGLGVVSQCPVGQALGPGQRADVAVELKSEAGSSRAETLSGKLVTEPSSLLESSVLPMQQQGQQQGQQGQQQQQQQGLELPRLAHGNADVAAVISKPSILKQGSNVAAKAGLARMTRVSFSTQLVIGPTGAYK